MLPVPEVAKQVPGAHIPLLDPFLPVTDVDAGVIAELRELFAEIVPFPFVLGEPARFPSGASYLPPQPVGVFRSITNTLRRSFPELIGPATSLYAAIPHLPLPDDDTVARRHPDAPAGACPGGPAAGSRRAGAGDLPVRHVGRLRHNRVWSA